MRRFCQVQTTQTFNKYSYEMSMILQSQIEMIIRQLADANSPDGSATFQMVFI